MWSHPVTLLVSSVVTPRSTCGHAYSHPLVPVCGHTQSHFWCHLWLHPVTLVVSPVVTPSHTCGLTCGHTQSHLWSHLLPPQLQKDAEDRLRLVAMHERTPWWWPSNPKRKYMEIVGGHADFRHCPPNTEIMQPAVIMAIVNE